MTKLRDATELLAAAFMAALVAVVLIQVIARYFLRISVSWSEESARYLLVWLTLIGAAAATARGKHIVIDSIIVNLPARVLRPVTTIALVASIVTLVALIWASLPLLGTAGNTTSPGSGIEVRWVRLALPVGASLAIVFFAAELVQVLRGGASAKPSEPAEGDSQTDQV